MSSPTASRPNETPRVYGEVQSDDYVLLSPVGDVLKVDAAVFNALSMFVGQNDKPAGTIQIECNRGAVGTVKVTHRLK